MENDLTLQPASPDNDRDLDQIGDQEVALVEGEGEQSQAVVEDAGNFVKMFLSAAGVQFKLHTRVDPASESTELAAQLKLALTLLQASEARLEQAHIRIGQLQSQVDQLKRADKTESSEAPDIC